MGSFFEPRIQGEQLKSSVDQIRDVLNSSLSSYNFFFFLKDF